MFNHGGYIHVPVHLYDEVFFINRMVAKFITLPRFIELLMFLFVESKVLGRKGPTPAEKNCRITGPDPATGAKDRPPEN